MEKVHQTKHSDFKSTTLCIVALCAALSIFSSCAKEELDYSKLNTIGDPKEISADASLPESESIDKTTIDSDGHVLWERNDSIVINTTVVNDITVSADGKQAKFKGRVGAVSNTHYWAIYPCSIASRIGTDYARDNTIVTLPGLQTCSTRANSIQNYMVAHVETSSVNLNLNFKNLCCILKIPVKKATGKTGDEARISRIEITSDQYLSGSAKIIVDAEGNPKMNFVDGKNGLKLDCGKKDLSSTPDTFKVMIPSGNHTLNVKFYDATDKFVEKKISGGKFSRSCIYTMNGVVLDGKEEDPYLQADYSVTPTKKVTFALGNLQWSAYGNGGYSMSSHATRDGRNTQGTFRIAEHQWDYIGLGNETYPGNVYYSGGGRNEKCNNNHGAKDYKSYYGWIDLFCFGASGYNGKAPHQTGIDLNFDIANSDYDWGHYNTIRYGSTETEPGTWRLLTRDEWDYLMNMENRSDYRQGSRFAMAMVHDVKGFLIYPDNYDTTAYANWMATGTHPRTGTSKTINGIFAINKHGSEVNGYPTQSVDTATWKRMEKQGILFLPITGSRSTASSRWDRDVSQNEPYAHYWTSTYWGYGKSSSWGNNGNQAYNTHICKSHTQIDYKMTISMYAVRLVKDRDY